MRWFCQGRPVFPRSQSFRNCSLVSVHCLSGGTQVDAWCKQSLSMHIRKMNPLRNIVHYCLFAGTHLFIPLACAECDDSLPFSGASSISLCYITFPSTHFHQLVFPPPSLHHAIYFLVYLSALLFPNSHTIPFWGVLFSSILCTCPKQRNLFKLIVSVMAGFLNIA